MRWLILVVVACGAPSPAPIAKQPPRVITGDPKPITCADVAVILRGKVEDDRAAGPEREAAIAKACLHDKWSRDVIDCIGSSAVPRPCLDRLGNDQRAAFNDRLIAWNDAFPDEDVDDEIQLEPEPEDFVDCGLVIGDVSRYAPPLQQKGKDRELATALRRAHVLELCEVSWSTEVRRCFEKGEIEKCRTALAQDVRQNLADGLDEIDNLMVKVDELQKKPAQITCKKVVEAHYSDARWKGKLDAMKPKEKKAAIVESRTRMLKACTADQWSATVRACVVAHGYPLGVDSCFTASGMTTWDYPASGIAVRTGIAECDAYGDVLRALAACTSIPQPAVQAMLDNYRQMVTTLANMKPAERTAAGKSCAAADSAIRQSAASLGCTI